MTSGRCRNCWGELLGHADVSTTMIYTHGLDKGVLGVTSPADKLLRAVLSCIRRTSSGAARRFPADLRHVGGFIPPHITSLAHHHRAF